jgi:sugar/nucleoside kinase (ribokinase family)
MPCSVDAASAAPLRRVGPAFLDWLAGVDLLLANADEAAVLGPARVGALVVKRGELGATWTAGDETITVPAPPVAVVDTTGAGDAFAAGLLAARLRGESVEAALTAAVALGSRAVGQLGARPSEPATRRAQ